MNPLLTTTSLMVLVLAGCASTGKLPSPTPQVRGPVSEKTPRLELQSEDLPSVANMPQDVIFQGFGCTGQNQSPAIQWSNAPKNVKSYAVVAHDPDAPTGGTGFFHWVLFDIPGDTLALSRGKVPSGARVGMSDFGTASYGGPCPPVGETHRYNFTVYALDVPSLGLTGNPSAAMLRFAMTGHVLAAGTLTGSYHRM